MSIINTITSLEDYKRNAKIKRLGLVKKGKIYPLPINDADFNILWGVRKGSIKNVSIKNIKYIGNKK